MIEITINVERQDIIDMGLNTEGENVKCMINPNHIAFFYDSFDDGKGHLGTKIHFSNGECVWCYESYGTIKSRLNII